MTKAKPPTINQIVALVVDFHPHEVVTFAIMPRTDGVSSSSRYVQLLRPRPISVAC